MPLAQIDYPDTRVKVDVCENCGDIWLDRGEFRAINRERAVFQDRLKFHEKHPKPESLRDAVVQFVNRFFAQFFDSTS